MLEEASLSQKKKNNNVKTLGPATCGGCNLRNLEKEKSLNDSDYDPLHRDVGSKSTLRHGPQEILLINIKNNNMAMSRD